jgi:hypothetical protein
LQKRLLIYGPPFSGKTHQVALLTKLGHKLTYFDFDGNAQTLAKGNGANINYFNCTHGQPSLESFIKLFSGRIKTKTYYNNLTGALSESATSPTDGIWDPENFSDILVIDSITNLQEVVIAKIAGPSSLTGKLDFDGWAALGLFYVRLINNLKAIKNNSIVITHEDVLIADDKIQRISPRVGTRNKSLDISKDFTATLYTKIDGLGKQVITDLPVPGIVTGNRELALSAAPIKDIPLSTFFGNLT